MVLPLYYFHGRRGFAKFRIKFHNLLTDVEIFIPMDYKRWRSYFNTWKCRISSILFQVCRNVPVKVKKFSSAISNNLTLFLPEFLRPELFYILYKSFKKRKIVFFYDPSSHIFHLEKIDVPRGHHLRRNLHYGSWKCRLMRSLYMTKFSNPLRMQFSKIPYDNTTPIMAE